MIKQRSVYRAGTVWGAALLALAGAVPGPAGGAPPATGSAAAYVGANIDAIQDWTRDRLFADAMKSARPFGSVAAPWDEAAPLDADGWPTGDAAVVVMADQPGIDGTYKLSCSGRGSIRAGGGVQIRGLTYRAETDTTTADVVVAGAEGIFLTFTGFPGGVKHVKLMRPGHGLAETFNRDALARLRHFSTLRTLEYAQVNGSPEVRWAERTLPGHATQQRRVQRGPQYGAAWEYFIQLCNTLGKDAWINVPDQANDDYVRQLATLFKNGLNPELKLYVEYSNELWNFASGFPQSHRNLQASSAEVAAGDPHRYRYDGEKDRYALAWRRVAFKTKSIADIFGSVFGEAGMAARVRPVLAAQTYNEATYLQGLRYLEHVFGPPRQFLHGLAGTTYFYLPEPDRPGLTVDQVFAGLDLAATRQALSRLSAWAWVYGLRPLCYEGTHHMSSEKNGAVLVQANHDPRMKEALLRMYRDWFEVGGTLHMFSAVVSRWTGNGQWGLSEMVNSEATPKWEAVKQVLAGPLPAPRVGTAIPAALAPSDAAVQGSGSSLFGTRRLRGPDPDIGYLLRAPAAGSYTIAAGVSGGKVQVEVDGQILATWPPGPGKVDVQLGAGLHGLRLRAVEDGSAAVEGVRVTGG